MHRAHCDRPDLAHPESVPLLKSAQPAPEQFAVERDPRLRLIIPGIVAFAFLMEQIDQTIVIIAIPRMAVDLNTTVLRMNLAVTAYVLTLAVFIPISGWFADRFGTRRIFTLALLVFTVSSVLCGMADSLGMLVATRALQGLGGAMMTPVGRLILLRSFPRSQLFTAMVYMSIPALMGPVIGPLLGGLLTSYASWRWIFFINIPFGAVGIALALRFIEETRSAERTRFDVLGFVLVGAGLAMLQFVIENMNRPILPSWMLLGLVGLAAFSLLAFAAHARRTAAPAVDLTLFHLRSFRIGTLAGAFCRIGVNGVPYLLPLMLQIGLGLSPVAAGSLVFFTSLGALVIRPVSARLLKALGFDRVLLHSAVLAVISIAGFALVGTETPHWLLAIYISIFGFTRSTQFMASNTLSYADMPAEQLSRATSLGGVLQQLTISLGVSLSATLLGLVSIEGQALRVVDFHRVFLLIALIPLLSIPGFLRLRPEDGAGVSGHQRRAPRKSLR
jgi:EmrB/QacA subfamily drug resistance transporter